MRDFSVRPQASRIFDFGSGFLARVIILAVGIALVFCFQLWGFMAYLAVTVVFCRYAANMRGVTVRSYRSRTGRSAPNIYVFLYCTLFVIGLSITSMFFRNLDVVNLAVLTWNKAPMLSGLLNCNSKYDFTTFSSCKALHTATGTYVFLIPILFAFWLHHLIEVSQDRIRVSGSFVLRIFVFTTALFIALAMIPADSFIFSSYLPVVMLLILFFLPISLIVIWVKLTGE